MHEMSLKKRLFVIFGLIAIVPILFFSIIMSLRVSRILTKNTRQQSLNNLNQVANNLDLGIRAYEDLLYQMYSNDDLVGWADNLNKGENIAVTTSQLRRYLGGLLYSKDYIKSITVLTENGTIISYDQMTKATYINSWIDNYSLGRDEIYRIVSADNGMHMFSTEYGTTFANEDYYLFHVAHRIINYKKLEERYGIVILSLDENFFEEILMNGREAGAAFTFIVDDGGRLVSRVGDRIGTCEFAGRNGSEERSRDYEQFVASNAFFDANAYDAFVHTDTELGFDLVNVVNRSIYDDEIKKNVWLVAFFGAVFVLFTTLIIWRVCKSLSASIDEVVTGMQKVGSDNIPDTVPIGNRMLPEIRTIAHQYNSTIQKLNEARASEQEEIANRQQAEIRMLEAQINPHFIYNTLDTINWMAIDRDEYDISNAISAMATILRYAISDSDKTVTVADEAQWLNKYIYLQQFRLKNKFSCRVDISPDIMDCHIHKLLIQPFVENAIIHGFDGTREVNILEISMQAENDMLNIVIRDNGKGMSPELVDIVNKGDLNSVTTKAGIGLGNALIRLHKYCNGHEKVLVTSAPGEGTEVRIVFPIEV